MEETTREGIAALKRGHTARARELLRQAVEENPDDLKAWLWLSGAVESDEERVECLQRVLELNPDHEAARLGLAKLTTSAGPTEEKEAEAPPDEEAQEAEVRDAEASAAPPPEAAPAVGEEPSEASAEPEPAPEAESEGAEPEPERETETAAKTGVIRFKTGPSVLPTLLVGLLWALLLAALYAAARFALPSDQLLLAAVVLAFVGVVIATQLGARILQLISTRYAVTSRHLIAQRGVISQTGTKVPLEAIQDASVQQTWLERPFGVGDVLVQTAAEHGTVVLEDLPRYELYSEAILKAAEEVWARLPSG